jgi:hypothetical protein
VISTPSASGDIGTPWSAFGGTSSTLIPVDTSLVLNNIGSVFDDNRGPFDFNDGLNVFDTDFGESGTGAIFDENSRLIYDPNNVDIFDPNNEYIITGTTQVLNQTPLSGIENYPYHEPVPVPSTFGSPFPANSGPSHIELALRQAENSLLQRHEAIRHEAQILRGINSFLSGPSGLRNPAGYPTTAEDTTSTCASTGTDSNQFSQDSGASYNFPTHTGLDEQGAYLDFLTGHGEVNRNETFTDDTAFDVDSIDTSLGLPPVSNPSVVEGNPSGQFVLPIRPRRRNTAEETAIDSSPAFIPPSRQRRNGTGAPSRTRKGKEPAAKKSQGVRKSPPTRNKKGKGKADDMEVLTTNTNDVNSQVEDPKPKRVRTGCLTCRERHLKCDERQPTCLNCKKSNRMCRRGLRLNFIDTKCQHKYLLPLPTDFNYKFQDDSREIASEYKGGIEQYAPWTVSEPKTESFVDFADPIGSSSLSQPLPPIVPSYGEPAEGRYAEYRETRHAHTHSTANSTYSDPPPPQRSPNNQGLDGANDMYGGYEEKEYLDSPEDTLYMQVFVEEVGLWMDSMDHQKHVRPVLPNLEELLT